MMRIGLLLLSMAMIVQSEPALAQTIDLKDVFQSEDGSVSGRIIQLFTLLTVLSVAPGILVTMTSFTRIIIALSMLRSGLGLPGSPPNIVLTSLALFMTYFVMAPVFNDAWRNGLEPLIQNEITQDEAFDRIRKPFEEFMRAQVRPVDIALFEQLRAAPSPKVGAKGNAGTELGLEILIPAFLVSELRRGFEIGFLILLPFLIIDLIVATIIMAMGMMMMPPNVVALPFKILFLVLIDGWNLIVGNLVRSFF